MAEMAAPIPAELASAIRLVILDVDGVLTDGGVYLGATETGERIETKRYDITDGLGIKLLENVGITVAIVTGRESLSVKMRAEELGIRECHQGAGSHKIPLVTEMLERLGIDWSETAFVGDDLADLPVLRQVGLPVAVANAVPDVRALARWRCTRSGGHGAIREFADALLHARGQRQEAIARYLAPREEGS